MSAERRPGARNTTGTGAWQRQAGADAGGALGSHAKRRPELAEFKSIAGSARGSREKLVLKRDMIWRRGKTLPGQKSGSCVVCSGHRWVTKGNGGGRGVLPHGARAPAGREGSDIKHAHDHLSNKQWNSVLLERTEEP